MKKFIISAVAAAALIFTSCLSSSTAAGNVNADRKQLLLVSAEEMDSSAKEAYAEVIEEAKKAGTLNKDPAVKARVQKIADRLIAKTEAFRSDALQWDWQVNVISEETVNAWCMPGGKIVVYTGIIDSLKLTDGELAAVMGHEIAHALREHSRERASQSQVTNIALSAIISKAGLNQLGATGASYLAQYAITLPNSRKHETEADHVGTELMARAGYNPQEAVNVWEKMTELGGSSGPEIMSTHPSNESRIKDLEQICVMVEPLYKESKK